jgi:hypothetical protein
VLRRPRRQSPLLTEFSFSFVATAFSLVATAVVEAGCATPVCASTYARVNLMRPRGTGAAVGRAGRSKSVASPRRPEGSAGTAAGLRKCAIGVRDETDRAGTGHALEVTGLRRRARAVNAAVVVATPPPELGPAD